MIINSQQTIYQLDLDMYKQIGRPYRLLPNTTLNEKFNVLPAFDLADRYPTLKYLCIGSGGSNIVNNVLVHSEHSPINGALFKHTPFVMRTTDNDLLPDERLKYRLRVTSRVNGVDYYIYYMKVIDDIHMENKLFEVTSSNGELVLSFFDTNNANILTPIPMDTSNILNVSQSRYIVRSNKLMFKLTTEEILEIENASNLLYGTPARLTEIGVCTGIEDSSLGYLEVGGCQISYHVKIDLEMGILINDGKEVLRTIEVGGGRSMEIS